MAAPLDPTFRSYDAQQAVNYALNRGQYTPRIIQEIITYHAFHKGLFGVIMDVGCGTGKATRHLAPYFEYATGSDPGNEMIAQALKTGGQSSAGRVISYEVLDAEKLDQSAILSVGSVDLLTAAMAVSSLRPSSFVQ